MPDKQDAFQFENSDDSPGFSLWQVSSMWQRQINAGLRPFDLTHAQFVLLASLMWLASEDKPITQVELANHAKNSSRAGFSRTGFSLSSFDFSKSEKK